MISISPFRQKCSIEADRDCSENHIFLLAIGDRDGFQEKPYET